MDWEFIIKVIGFVLGSVISVIQIRNRFPKSRATLKADLEILKLMKPGDPLSVLVKQGIDGRIHEIYGHDDLEGGRVKIKWVGPILSALILLSFAGWTAFIMRNGFSWLAIPTIAIAVLSFFALIGSVLPDKPKIGAPLPTKNNEESE